jgi:hypothetical protein
MATEKQNKLMEVIQKEIKENDYSDPVTYVDCSSWARSCRWTVAATRGVFGSLIKEGLLLTDATEDSLDAARVAQLSARNGGYEGCTPTCWFPTI